MGATETNLAGFVLDYPTGQIPQDIMHLAKRGFMNYCSVALYAATNPAIDILLDVFRAEGGSPVATVLGKGFRTSAQNAALANGFLGHYEDYDDTHNGSGIHPASPIVPAALALGEQLHVSGRDLLAAYAIGVEVACRVGTLISHNFRDGAENWHITNTCGVLGAVAAAGRLLGLSRDQMVYAFAIAGTQAMGVREVFGSMCKPFHAGKAAQNGTLAAMLAARGFTATDGIFEGPRGLVGTMATGHDVAQITADLGSHWELSNAGLKFHASPAATQGFVDAILALRTRPGVSPETVKHIQGTTRQLAPAVVRRRHPRTGLESKFCYYHVIAVALTDGCAFPAQFVDARVNDPALESLRNRIDMSEDASFPRGMCVITMELMDGTILTERVPHATGRPENPLTDAQVQEKFTALAAAVLPPERVERARRALWEVDQLSSVTELVPLLSA